MSSQSEFSDISYFSAVKITRTNIYNGLHKAAGKYAKGKLVDLGCGIKPYQSIFTAHVDSYFGVDYPSTADGNYGSETKADLFIDCVDTKIDAESFDTLLSTQVMEHIFDTQKYLSECCRLLKKSGIGIFTVPFVWQCHAEPFDFYRFTKFSLEKLFVEYGFEIVELKELEGAYATLIQAKIVSLYCYPGKNMLVRIFQKCMRTFWMPVLNFCALHLDNLFYNDKLCLNYLIVVRKK